MSDEEITHEKLEKAFAKGEQPKLIHARMTMDDVLSAIRDSDKITEDAKMRLLLELLHQITYFEDVHLWSREVKDE